MTAAPPAGIAELARHLEEHAFRPAAGRRADERLVGAEVELLALDGETGRPAALEGGAGALLPLLRRLGAERGWRERRSAKGIPAFELPGGGVLGFEPGGQIEYGTAPQAGASALIADLRGVLEPLRRAADAGGIVLLSEGIDPVNPPARAPLQLSAERYCRMADYFASLGPAGARMMRQTAALQISVDLGERPFERWRLLNAIAPLLVAIFANSPRYAGAATGHRSFRAATWRVVDSSRTGLCEAGPAPVAEYLELALAAPHLFRRTGDGRYRPFVGWLARGEASPADWDRHLTTLFPEIRPRGYFELRSLDALPPDAAAAAIALVTGLVYDPVAARETAALAGTPDLDLLVRAGRHGLEDPVLGERARDLVELGLAGMRRLGPAWLASADREAAADFFRRYTGRGRMPADDLAAAEDRAPGSPPGG